MSDLHRTLTTAQASRLEVDVPGPSDLAVRRNAAADHRRTGNQHGYHSEAEGPDVRSSSCQLRTHLSTPADCVSPEAIRGILHLRKDRSLIFSGQLGHVVGTYSAGHLAELYVTGKLTCGQS